MFLFPKKPAPIVSKKTELLGSTQLLHLLENLHESIFCLDNSLTYLYINPSYIKLTGYNESDLIGKSFLETVIIQEDRIAAQNLFNGAIKTGAAHGQLLARNKEKLGFCLTLRIIKRVNELNETIGCFGFVAGSLWKN